MYVYFGSSSSMSCTQVNHMSTPPRKRRQVIIDSDSDENQHVFSQYTYILYYCIDVCKIMYVFEVYVNVHASVEKILD